MICLNGKLKIIVRVILQTILCNKIYKLFSGNYFHIGGDENEGKDWDSNPKIQEFKKKNNFANKKLRLFT